MLVIKNKQGKSVGVHIFADEFEEAYQKAVQMERAAKKRVRAKVKRQKKAR